MNHDIILAEIKKNTWIETCNEDELKKRIVYWENTLLDLFPKGHEVFSMLAEISFEPKATDPKLYKNKKQEAIEKARKDLKRLFEKILEFYNRIPTINMSFEEIIKRDESHYLEYKASLVWGTSLSVYSGPNRIMKSIAAFLNSDGGVLVIGIEDNKKVRGINKDYNKLDNYKPPEWNNGFMQNKDGFRNCLYTLLPLYFSDSIINDYIKVEINEINKREICLIRIKKSDKPVIISKKNKHGLTPLNLCHSRRIDISYDKSTKTLTILGKENGMKRADLFKALTNVIINSKIKDLFYIRVDNSSRLLTGTSKIADYVFEHFKKEK